MVSETLIILTGGVVQSPGRVVAGSKPGAQDRQLEAVAEQVRQGGEQKPHFLMEASVYWNVPGLLHAVQVDEGDREYSEMQDRQDWIEADIPVQVAQLELHWRHSVPEM